MKYFVFTLIALILSQNSFAQKTAEDRGGLGLKIMAAQADKKQESEVKTVQHKNLTGYETIGRGFESQPDDIYGIIAVPNSYHETIKFKNGKETLNTAATIDKDGFRNSSASRRLGKSKHLLLINSSMVFGEGLVDDETLAHLINLNSNTFEAYPLAFYGYGPQHAWLSFKHEKLPEKIREKKGLAILFTHRADILRFFPTIGTMTESARMPFIEEESIGNFVYRGNFINTGNWWRKLVFNYCIPIMFCAHLTRKFKFDPSDEQYAIIGRLFEDIERMYKKQFDVEDFKIIFLGPRSQARKFAPHTKVEVIPLSNLRRDLFTDGHLKARGMQKITNFLFDAKLIY